jgi:hypothetical protein
MQRYNKIVGSAKQDEHGTLTPHRAHTALTPIAAAFYRGADLPTPQTKPTPTAKHSHSKHPGRLLPQGAS